MKLTIDNFNKKTMSAERIFGCSQYCDWCRHDIKENEDYYMCDPYYKENCQICESCFCSL